MFYLEIFSIIFPTLLSVAFYTLLEGKVIGSVQRRVGPNYVGFIGILQPIMDGLKLISKEIILPYGTEGFIFIISPIIVFVFSMGNLLVIPFTYFISFFNWDFGLLIIFLGSSLGIYGLLLAGWSSNSVYAFMGSIGCISQMLAYEIVFGLIICIFGFVCGSFSIYDIIVFQEEFNLNFFIPLLPIAVILYVSILAETNRVPFDLAEAESELVAGYNVEYSGFLFALFFLAEYSSMGAMAALFVSLFFGNGSYFFFFFKIMFINISFILVGAFLPGYRFDQLLDLGWIIFIPFLLSFLIIIIIFIDLFFFFVNFFIF